MADRTVRVRLEAAVEGLVGGFTKAQVSVDSFASQAEKKLAGSKQSLDTLSRTAGLLGGVIAVGVGAAVKSFADFDKQMSSVAATGSDAKDNLQALRDTAVDAGAKTAFSATEAAQGVENLLKAGVSAKDVIGGGLTGALDLAAAGSLDVGDAAEIAATAMTQFGLAGKDVPHIADLIAAGAGKAQGDVSDLAAALKQGGLVAASYGLTLEETTGTLAAFASAGLIGSDAGTSFKTMLQALGNPSAKAASTLKELGISAYDLNGNFVGTVGLAQQLQDKLGGLTQEQRNAALATIFGADAVRAANVLYEQGGAGIQSWVDQVNDAGYAAQVAATKQDNLSGDLERLGGTLDSVFLKSGSGANDTLRELAKSADGLLNKVGDLPPGLLQAGLGIAAVGSGGLLAFAGITRLATGAVELRGALKNIAPEGSKTAGALGAAGKAAGVAVIAFGALTAAVALSNQLTGDVTPKSSEATAALIALGNGAASAGQTLDQFFTTSKDGVSGLNGLADAAGTLAGANSVELWAANAARALGVQSNVVVQAQDRFTELDRSLSAMATNGSAEQAGKAYLELSKEVAKAGLGYEELGQKFPAYKASLVDQANQLGVTTLSARDYAAWMQGQVPAAVAAASAANPELAASLGQVSEKAAEATQSATDLVNAYFAVGQAALAASNSEIGYEQAVDDAAGSLKDYTKGLVEKYKKQGKSTEAAGAAAAADIKSGKALDKHTDAGRKNRSALNQIAAATQKLVSDQASNKASSETLAKTTAKGRAEFIRAATQMGATGKQARALADKYGLIPKNVKTAVTAPGATTSAGQAKDLNNKLRNLPKSTATAIRSTFDKSGYNAAITALNNLPSFKTIVVTTNYKTNGSPRVAGGMVASANAFGGMIGGYSPHPRADNLLSWVTAGEFMQDVPSVKRYGPDFHQALLGGLIDPAAARALLPGHAYGGLVDAASRPATRGVVTQPREVVVERRIVNLAPVAAIGSSATGAEARPVEQNNYFTQQEDPELTARYLGRRLQTAMAGGGQ